MNKLSVSVTAEQEVFINTYIKAGNADTIAQVVCRALNRFAEDEAVNAVLQSERELGEGRVLYGDLRKLAKKIK